MDTYRHRHIILKVLKIAVGSCLAIVIAEFFALQYAASAGIITLLTVQDTRKGTIQLALDRIMSFLMSIVLIFLCFHATSRLGWINYGSYIFLMVIGCYYFEWQNAVSVNAVMGTHYLMSPDYSLGFALSELFLVLIGTGVAMALNWKMPSSLKVIRQDMKRIEDAMQQVLREISGYLADSQSGELVWLDLDMLETDIHKGLKRAHEQAHNTMAEEDLYYVGYMEMRLQQCVMLQTLRERVWKIREMPRQAEPVSRYLDYVADYVHEETVPGEQLEKLGQVFEQMKREPLPVTREEFENRAILYHVLMDLEEFLFVKQRFSQSGLKRPDDL
ncbi:MAG: hypothetical protein HFI15_03075 [Lachnospiraceae bacterium]|nr:hypothetical protein [Lachnospiraceae bacterium]